MSQSTIKTIDVSSLTPYQAFLLRKKIGQKKAELEKLDKQVKEVLESAYKSRQLRLETDGHVLTRKLKTVAPFENPGYSYFIYSLE